MKALTISQPFASLIASGEKWIENRTWETLYRGKLAIHAGKGTHYMTRHNLEIGQFPTGCVIAVADLVACIHIGSVLFERDMGTSGCPRGCARTWKEIAFHSHCEGPYCWILENVAAVEPVIMRGKQGLWGISADVKFEAINRGSRIQGS